MGTVFFNSITIQDLVKAVSISSILRQAFQKIADRYVCSTGLLSWSLTPAFKQCFMSTLKSFAVIAMTVISFLFASFIIGQKLISFVLLVHLT